jgi:hypothetical protein
MTHDLWQVQVLMGQELWTTTTTTTMMMTNGINISKEAGMECLEYGTSTGIGT